MFPSHASAFRMPLKVWCSFEVLRALWKCLSKRSQEVSQAPQGQLFPTQQLQTALRSERSKCPLEAGVLSHSGKGCFHWGSGNVELPCYIPPIQGKESSVKCEMGINHIYSSQETWDMFRNSLSPQNWICPLAGGGKVLAWGQGWHREVWKGSSRLNCCQPL